MKKSGFIAFVLMLALLFQAASLMSVPVGAGYADGEIIYSEDYDGKTAADLNYSLQWYTGAQNFISYTVSDGALSITSTKPNANISYLELVSAQMMGDQSSYTVSMDIMPLSLDSKSYGLGIAIHSAFPTDKTQTNDYDSYVFRDYNANKTLSFARFLRDNGANKGTAAIASNLTDGYGKWYSVKLEVEGKKVSVYFNGSEKPTVITNSYTYKSPICLVSVGSSSFKVDNVKVWAGVGTEPVQPASYDDGKILFFEDYEGELPQYGLQWFAGAQNYLTYKIEDGALSVSNKAANSAISYLELLPASVLGAQTAYTVQLDIMPVSIPSASYGFGIALHTAFPADESQTNDYDSYVFRDYSLNGNLTFARYLRDDGKNVSGANIIGNLNDGYNEWYRLKLTVDGSTVSVYFNGSNTPDAVFTNSYPLRSPICLVSVGTSSFKADNIKIWAGTGAPEDEGDIPSAPIAPTLKWIYDSSAAVYTVSGQEYSIDGGKTWNVDGIFYGLKPNTVYSVKARYAATEDSPASYASKELKIKTPDRAAAPEAPILEEIGANSVKVYAVPGQEYSIDGGKTWNETGVFGGLYPLCEYEIITRVKATPYTSAGYSSPALKVKTGEAKLAGLVRDYLYNSLYIPGSTLSGAYTKLFDSLSSGIPAVRAFLMQLGR